MAFQIIEEPIATLAEQGRIPMVFEYDSIFEVNEAPQGAGEFVLTEVRLAGPQIKDYDAIEGNRPADWKERFRIDNWGFLVARVTDEVDGATGDLESRYFEIRIGGAVIAFGDPKIDMLEGRSDLAVLWDVRVAPNYRGQGIGAALFKAAEKWAVARGCRQLKIETQNNNVAACKFYASQGCSLGAVNRTAYPELPQELQMLWYKELF